MENKELLLEVESLIQEVEKTHRYSMSRVYGAYNKAFGKDEKPQACASCLIRKVKELKKWFEENQTTAAKIETKKPASTVKKTAAKPRKKKAEAKPAKATKKEEK